MIAAGKRHRRITIEARSTSKGTYGEQAATWSTIATVWASIRGLQGRELQAAQQLNTEVSHKITITWAAAFADPVQMAKYRISYGTRIFNIHASINTDERNREIVLLCTEGVNNG